MDDERDDLPDADQEPAPVSPARRDAPVEGVRIIGAEEARAAIEGGQVKRRLADNEPRFGDVPPRPEAPAGRTVRFPLPNDLVGDAHGTEPDEIVIEHSPEPPPVYEAPATPPVDVPIVPVVSTPTPSSPPSVRVVRPVVPPDVEVSGPVEMPHWTEPPTGEVPRILPEQEPEEALVEDDDEQLDAWAALGSQAPRFRDSASDWDEEDFTPATDLKDDTTQVGALAEPVDDDAEFAREVAQRRRRRSTATTGGPRGRGDRGDRPAAASAAGAPSAPPAGRNLPVAVATGVGIALVAVACMLLGPPWVLALATIIIAMATVECFEGLRRAGNQPATLLAILGAVTLVIAVYHRGTVAYPLVFALVVFFTMLWYLAEVVHAPPVKNIGLTLLGFCWVGFFGSFAGLILAMPWQTASAKLDANDGIGIILGLALCAVGSDIVGYFVGSRFGKTRIAPRISPNKTLEGFLAGAVASVLIALVIAMRFQPWGSFRDALALGVVVAVMAPLGDLVESMIKRDLKIKDFGTILPGHGGIMDRFDAILVCLPAVYFLARALFG